MHRRVLEIVVAAVLLGVAAYWVTPIAWAQRDGAAMTGPPVLMAIPVGTAQDQPLVAVIDGTQRRMAVYQIGSNGQISLKSVRNLTWDLALEQFNVGAPAPDEIRAMLPR